MKEKPLPRRVHETKTSTNQLKKVIEKVDNNPVYPRPSRFETLIKEYHIFTHKS